MVEPRDAAIVIVAPPGDTHAALVQQVLRTRFGTEALLWDTAGAGAGDGLSFTLDRDDPDLADLEVTCGGRRLALGDVRSVWWRRPHGFGLDAHALTPQTLRFCTREYTSLLLGALAGLRTPVVNSPAAEGAAQHKPLQLAAAQRAGLVVPATLVSNDPARVRDFWRAQDRDCVYKTLTPSPGGFRETRRLDAADLTDLARLTLAPVIVQRRLGGLDVRVTVVGDQHFAAVAGSSHPDARTDWRLDLTCTWAPYALEATLADRLRTLLDDLGLHYGCVDLRLDDDGVAHFLEVNPSGQFLFVEVDTAQPIVEAMCTLLLHAGAHPLG